jgi:peptidoglycan-associated lipoprotein
VPRPLEDNPIKEMTVQIQWTLSAILVAGLGCSHAKPARHGATSMADALKAPPARGQAAASDASRGQDDKFTKDSSIYFSFDSYQLDQKAKPILESIADQAKHGREVRVEGNCDERGTTEYNLALGDRRAHVVVEYLEHLGVASDKVVSVTFGSERPKVMGHDESAWAQNRRDDVVVR